MSTAVAADRVAKYRRVLPCLRLDHAVVLRGQPLAVLVEGLAEHCDVLVRLIDDSERIHAETQLMLGPDTAAIPLGHALNIPSGRYQVLATPPLDQFHGSVRVERRIPVTIAADEHSASLYGDTPGRAAELLDRLAEASGPLAALVRINRRPRRQRDDATVAEAVREGRLDLAFAAAFATAAQHAEETQEAATEALQLCAARDDLVGQIAAVLLGGSDAGLDAALRAAGLSGSGIDEPEAVAALVALSFARPARAGLAEAVLDRIALGHALRSNAGVVAAPGAGPSQSRANGLAALSRLLWGVGSFGVPDAATVALALSGYEPAALIQAIALDPAPRETVEPDAAGGTLMTYASGEVATTVHSAGWQVRIGPDIVLAGRCKSAASSPVVVMALGASVPLAGFHAFDEMRIEDDRILARVGEHVLALYSDQPFHISPDPDGAGRVLSGGGSQWTCQVGSTDRYKSLEGFARECAAPVDGVPRTPDGTTLTASGMSGEPERLTSPMVRYDDDVRAIQVRFRDHGLVLDFS